MIPNNYLPLYDAWRESPDVLGQRVPTLVLDVPDIGMTPWGDDLLALPIPPFSHPMKWATIFLIEASRTDLRAVLLMAESWVAEASDEDDRSPRERLEAGDPTVETYISCELWTPNDHYMVSQRQYLDDAGGRRYDPPTAAVETSPHSAEAMLLTRAALLAVSGIDLDQRVGQDEERSVLAHAADVLDVLNPRTVEIAERVLAETLPDGWTATVASYVVLAHDDGREFVASYRGEPLTERFTWWGACAPTDDDPDRQVGANTLAELIEAVTS